MTQTLHIFRKDLRHHWPFAAVAQLVAMAIHLWLPLNLFPESAPHYDRVFPLLFLLQPISYLLLVARLVHDEALVGTMQFWLARPYDWRCLLAAKGLFLVLVLHGPLFFIQAGALARNGFPPGPHLGILLAQQAALFCAMVLLGWALAALTSQLAHFLLLALGSFLALTFGFEIWKSSSPSGLQWIPQFLLFAFGSAVAVLLLWWQYTRRGTRLAFGIAAAAFVVALILPHAVTASTQIAIQKWLSPGKAAPVFAAVLDPSLPKDAPAECSPAPDDVCIRLPLSVTGFEQREFRIHQMDALLVTPQGERLPTWNHKMYKVRNGQGRQEWWQVLQMKRRDLERLSAPVRVENNVVLSTYLSVSSVVLPLGLEPSWVDGVGWCVAGQWQGSFGLLVRCRRPSDSPDLVSVEPLKDMAGTITGGYNSLPESGRLGPVLNFPPVSIATVWDRSPQGTVAFRLQRLIYEFTGRVSWAVDGVSLREFAGEGLAR